MASIQKRGNRWYARYRDPEGREHAKRFDLKVDATKWLNGVTASMVTGQYVDPVAGKVSFAAYFADWSARQVWAPGTRRAMELAAGSVTFGSAPLASIKRSHVESWVKAMTTKPLAPGTIKTRFQNVRSVFRAAVRDKVIASDPTEDVALPRRRRADAAMTIPSVEQVGDLIRHAAPEFRAFVGLCAFAGLRLGETAALRASDIDFLRRQIEVRRQVQRENGGEVEIRAPKYGSERTVYVADDLLAMLSQHIAERRPGGDPDRCSSPARVCTLGTKTPSGTTGARRETRQASRHSSFTTYGTFTPLD